MIRYLIFLRNRYIVAVAEFCIKRLLEKYKISYNELILLYKLHCRDKYDHNKRSFPEILKRTGSLLKPDAFLDCEDVILLYEEFLSSMLRTICQKKNKALCATRLNSKIEITLMFVAPNKSVLKGSMIS
jgi:hypothetical protein